jgi:hypothetical protein
MEVRFGGLLLWLFEDGLQSYHNIRSRHSGRAVGRPREPDQYSAVVRPVARPPRRWLLLSGVFDLVRTDEKVSRYFPRFADLVDHVDRERAPPRENFRST